jgi:hypothetical protein
MGGHGSLLSTILNLGRPWFLNGDLNQIASGDEKLGVFRCRGEMVAFFKTFLISLEEWIWEVKEVILPGVTGIKLKVGFKRDLIVPLQARSGL